MEFFDFDDAFLALTGNRRLSWQKRLYVQHFEPGKLDSCSVIDIPTGLGKTMVMAIWLIARAQEANVPTRLIYVVDRRTVVDQATELAEDFAFLLAPKDEKEIQAVTCRNPKLVEQKRKFAETLNSLRRGLGIADSPLAISTLRGQLADNREWSKDPSRPAIIIGTVDLIGSGLLFSGYRSSFKRRPLEAGLLGQDSLLVLDEAHLAKPFEKLIRAVGDDGSFQKNGDGDAQRKPIRVIRMSATSGEAADSKPPFTLQFDANGNLTRKDASDAIITERFCAKKRLTIVSLGEKEKLVDKLAETAIDLIGPSKPEQKPVVGQRIVVFIRKPEDARSVADVIRKHGAKKNLPGPYAEAVEVLTGTMRGLERDKLVQKPVFKERWLNGDLKPDDPTNQSSVFLIATSAGEVGFDLNADHMVCDATTIDSLIQRLGRVNRRGTGKAQIHLFIESPKKEKDGKVKKLEGLDLAIANTIGLLQGIPDGDVSPKNIAALKKSEVWKEKYMEACSPDPATVELTDILLDNWSMTSITEPMRGRPEVGPWLRGIDEELPQTTVAWRAELELVKDHPDPAKTLQRIFSKHPIRPHESITTNSYRVVEFLKQACKLKDRPGELPNTRIALRLSRGTIVLRTIKELADDPGILNAEPTLILPANLGGLDLAGMLDAEAIPKTPRAGDPPPPSVDVADCSGYEQREDASPRLRLLIRRIDDAGEWAPESLPGGIAISDRLQLDERYATTTALFAELRRNDLRVRLVQPIELDEEGDAVRSLVALAPVSNRNTHEDQTLDDHVGAVEAEARRIADTLKLAEDDSIRVALLFAARWHDEGKKADVWQRFVCRDPNEPYKGKSSKTRDPKSLGGYRHEFGSLLRLHHSDRHNTTCTLPTDAVARDLAMHLIATHHGAGRPHFEPAVYRDFTTTESDVIHTESIRRFARLQRKYGWWHLAWLENLLRCADALASAEQDAEDDPADVEGDKT